MELSCLTLPDVTVITVCKNAGSDLVRTCDSVLGQVGIELQMVIQDGGSTDFSLAYLKSLEDPRVDLLSEPDSGIYDAMNRAFYRAQGRWCIYLNAGDCFYSNMALRAVLDEVENLEDPNLIVFSFLNEFDKTITTYPRNITKYFLYRNGINHQVQLWRTSSLKQYLPFDNRYQVLADHHLLLRAFISGIRIRSLKIVGVCYKDNGFSAQPQIQSLKKVEREKILTESFNSSERLLYSLLEVLFLKRVRLSLYKVFRKTFLVKWYKRAINSLYEII